MPSVRSYEFLVDSLFWSLWELVGLGLVTWFGAWGNGWEDDWDVGGGVASLSRLGVNWGLHIGLGTVYHKTYLYDLGCFLWLTNSPNC